MLLIGRNSKNTARLKNSVSNRYLVI